MPHPAGHGQWKKPFLESFAEHSNVRLACQAAGISRVTAYEQRKNDPEFAKAWKDAQNDACDILEQEARRRGMEQSDTLMIFLLKAHRPHIYRDNYQGSRGDDDGSDGDDAPRTPPVDPKIYAGRPVQYAQEYLQITTLTDVQKGILNALHTPPYKVLCPAAHDVGKTFLAAVAVNYWYDCFDPSVVITTAPTMRDVVDLLWTEVRLQRVRVGKIGDLSPKAPYMGNKEDHYAKGYTATTGESFQGRHRQRMLFVFDEASGIDEIYWLTFRTMFDPEQHHAALFIFNPTDTSSQAYREDSLIDQDDVPAYHRFRMNALDHPNILAELQGLPRPVPGAVSLRMLDEWLRDWCDELGPHDIATTEDLLWPPQTPEGDAYCQRMQCGRRWYRPGPVMQARGMGLWPTGDAGLWSDALWNACLKPRDDWATDLLPDIGVDCAQGKSEDYHAIHTRWGPRSLFHETSNTMNPSRVFERIKLACQTAADFCNQRYEKADTPLRISARQVRIKIDDDGTGNAISAFLASDGYNVQKVGAGTSAMRPNNYPRKRDELWFEVADRARAGLVSLADIKDERTLRRLKQQLMAVSWEPWHGMRRVEPKDETKEKLGRSPDDADAFNLAYYEAQSMVVTVHEPEDDDEPQPRSLGSWR